MNGCNMSFSTMEGLQRHILRHFEAPKLEAKPPKVPKPAPKVGRLFHLATKPPPLIPVPRDEAPPPPNKACQLEGSELSSESGGEGRRGSKSVVGQPLCKVRKRRYSFKVRIPRHRVMISTPFLRGPTPFNGELSVCNTCSCTSSVTTLHTVLIMWVSLKIGKIPGLNGTLLGQA